MGILSIISTVLALLPKVSEGLVEGQTVIAQSTQLYHALQGVFGRDILPDKTEAEIAQMSLEGFEKNLVDIIAERQRLHDLEVSGDGDDS